jgi:site-specific recombinase XerD
LVPSDSSNPTAIVVEPSDTASPAHLEGLKPLVDSAVDYMEEALATGTRAAYAKHWTIFERWCAEHGLGCLPATPEIVAMYVASRADCGWKVATIQLALSAIWDNHDKQSAPSARGNAIIKRTMQGIRRRLGRAQNAKDPLRTDDMRRLLQATSTGLIGARDRALLLLGFAGGFRRSELVALNVADLAFVKEGLRVSIRRSKTDQEGLGMEKAVTYGSDPTSCPVRAVQDWLELSGLMEGAVFRPIDRHGNIGARALSDFAVATVIKRTAKKAGMATPSLSGHSLRAGFVTEAAHGGADYLEIMKVTGQVKFDTVLKYDRRRKLWEKPASAKLGL